MSLNRLQKPLKNRGRAGIFRKSIPHIPLLEPTRHNI